MAKIFKSKYPARYWQLCIGALLFFLSFNMILPELPDHLERIGGKQYLGWIIGLFALGALVARPFSGWITDRYGRRWSILGGTAMCIVASCLYPFASFLSLFFVARAAHGFFTGFAPTGFTAYTTDIIPVERRGEALGWQGMFSNIGASLGFALGAWVVSKIGQNGLYWVAAGTGIMAVALFSTLPETRPEFQNPPKFVLREVLYFKVWKPALLMLLICIPIGGILLVMPSYSLACGFENKGVYLTIYIVASLFVRIFSGKLSDKLGRPYSTAIGSFMQIIAMVILAISATQTSLILSAVFYGIGQGFNAPGLFAWAGDDSETNTRGRALSMLFIALELGIFIGGLFAGHLYQISVQNIHVLFIFWACISTLGLLFSLLFIHHHQRNKATLFSDISEI